MTGSEPEDPLRIQRAEPDHVGPQGREGKNAGSRPLGTCESARQERRPGGAGREETKGPWGVG